MPAWKPSPQVLVEERDAGRRQTINWRGKRRSDGAIKLSGPK